MAREGSLLFTSPQHFAVVLQIVLHLLLALSRSGEETSFPRSGRRIASADTQGPLRKYLNEIDFRNLSGAFEVSHRQVLQVSGCLEGLA